jgi:ADP-ribosylglycohydrolase
MQEEYRGCMLGAAIGDALGMPNETLPPTLARIRTGYQRPSRWHPNAGLLPGQFTDDTQMMLLVAELFAEGDYSEQRYATRLRRAYDSNTFRFPDGSVASACEHLRSRDYTTSGISSTTSGCINLGLPFALVFDDVVEIRERLVQACSVTHTHPASHAAAISFAMLIHYALRGYGNTLTLAQKNASLEDNALGAKIREALRLEQEGISLQAALTALGNDVSVYQTMPVAFFLMSRYDDPETLLSIAASIGGNTDTIGFICGAYAGIERGISTFPGELITGLEDRERIERVAARLYQRYARKD